MTDASPGRGSAIAVFTEVVLHRFSGTEGRTSTAFSPSLQAGSVLMSAVGCFNCGPAVLEATASALGSRKWTTLASWGLPPRRGTFSRPLYWWSWKKLTHHRRPAPGTKLATSAAMGPGFAAELVALEWGAGRDREIVKGKRMKLHLVQGQRRRWPWKRDSVGNVGHGGGQPCRPSTNRGQGRTPTESSRWTTRCSGSSDRRPAPPLESVPPERISLGGERSRREAL